MRSFESTIDNADKKLGIFVMKTFRAFRKLEFTLKFQRIVFKFSRVDKNLRVKFVMRTLRKLKTFHFRHNSFMKRKHFLFHRINYIWKWSLVCLRLLLGNFFARKKFSFSTDSSLKIESNLIKFSNTFSEQGILSFCERRHT